MIVTRCHATCLSCNRRCVDCTKTTDKDGTSAYLLEAFSTRSYLRNRKVIHVLKKADTPHRKFGRTRKQILMILCTGNGFRKYFRILFNFLCTLLVSVNELKKPLGYCFVHNVRLGQICVLLHKTSQWLKFYKTLAKTGMYFTYFLTFVLEYSRFSGGGPLSPDPAVYKITTEFNAREFFCIPNGDIRWASRIITRVWSSYGSQGQTKLVWFLKIDVDHDNGQNQRSLNARLHCQRKHLKSWLLLCLF